MAIVVLSPPQPLRPGPPSILVNQSIHYFKVVAALGHLHVLVVRSEYLHVLVDRSEYLQVLGFLRVSLQVSGTCGLLQR